MAQSGNRPFVRAYRYYEILEISRNATQDEIRRAYLKLAKIYHPDVNPDAKAHEKFKKINEAYEILSDPTRRSSYDNSPAECPVCWTHEVIQTTEIHWRCRHCGCKFDPSRVSEIIEQVEKAAIPERLRNVLRIFQTTQCSWCRKFYTQPFLCPYSRLQSSCISFDRLGNEERGQLLGDKKWWWRMADMIQQVQERGIMAKCRECGALNPNPQKAVCWHCGRNTLCCPHCREAPILRYDIERDFWKCPNAGCGKKFALRPKKRVVEPTLSQEICPNCGKNLYYDAELLLWRCSNRNCRHIYTYQDLESQRAHRKAGPKETGQTRPRAERSYRPPSYRQPKKPRSRATRAGLGARKFLMGIAKLLLCLLVIAGISIIVWTGYMLFTHQISLVIGTIVFLAEIGLLIWIISVLRSSRFRWREPSFKLVFWPLVAIILVCAFAGVEPMSSAKDRVIDFIEQGWEAITTSSQSPTQAPEEPASTSAPPVDPSSTNTLENDIHSVEKIAFDLINSERVKAGLPATLWDDKLYELSEAHTQEMANRRELFHSPIGGPIGENAWGGYGYSQYSGAALAQVIVNSWMSSLLHKAWILHAPITHSVASIVSDSNGQYASWTFWTSEADGGPALIQRAYNLWQSETGGNIPWLTWLYDIKGYPNNQEFLQQLGIE